MQMFLGFIRKEFLHIFRDFRTLIILFGIPVVQILVFGYVIRNEIKDVSIAILDRSQDNTTNQLKRKILSSGYFKLVTLLSSDQEIDEVFKRNKVKEVILFENNFGESLERYGTANMQILTDASDPNAASLIVSYTQGIVHNYLLEINPLSAQNIGISIESRMMFNQGLKSVFMFVPGTMALILMLISAMMTSISIAREKETGTMEVLLISPLKPYQIIIGKVFPYILLAFATALIILAMGVGVFKLPIQGSLVLLLAESMLFIVLALSLGILISTLAPNQQVAMFTSMFALMLPTMLLSGFIFPIENMPFILQLISYIVPAKYYIIILKSIMLKGTGIFFIWKETLILIGITLFFLALSAMRFKVRLD